MTDEQRSALAAYFGLYKGQEEGLAKMYLSPTDHPFVASAYALMDIAWRQVCAGRSSCLMTQPTAEQGRQRGSQCSTLVERTRPGGARGSSR